MKKHIFCVLMYGVVVQELATTEEVKLDVQLGILNLIKDYHMHNSVDSLLILTLSK